MVEGSFPRRLSERRGLAQDDGPFEGVPAHLLLPLQQWARAYLGHALDDPAGHQREANIIRLAILCRVQVDDVRLYHRTLIGLAADEWGNADDFYDVVDLHLQLFGAGSDVLDALLRDGGSIWTVSDTPRRLERRASEEEHELYVRATAHGDDAAEQLREAWGKVYGRDPNPSDAWDHAIKAVEILLHPVVSPTNSKATLGSMLAALEARPDSWTVRLESSSKKVSAVEALTGMLRTMWPNPDRHGSGSGSSRPPTSEEAEQVVRLAVFAVSWFRVKSLRMATAPTGPSASQ